jgi:hypothetical protein
MPFVMAVIGAVLLLNVRQRAWIWIPASAAGYLLERGLVYLLFQSGLSWFENLTYVIEAQFGQFASWIGPMQIIVGLYALGDILCAAVLAWKMPPVVMISRKPSEPAIRVEC